MLTVEIARSLQDVLDAWHFLHEIYLEAGFVRPNPHKLHIVPQAINADALVVLARREGRVVGTISAIPDGPLGLPLDSVFPEELNALRAGDRKLFEFGVLGQSHGGLADILELVRYVYYHGIYLDGTDTVCGIPPKRTRQYCRLFGFRPIGEVQRYHAIEDNPVQLLHISADYAREHHARHRALRRIVQNPLPKSTFRGRFNFAPEALAGSPLESFSKGD